MSRRKYKNQAYKPVESPKEEKVERVREYINPISVQRLKQDIGKWRLALREAESVTNPSRFQMQQMYLDTVLNGHVHACLERRTMNVLKKGIQVISKDGVVNEGLTEIYSKKWMYDVLRYTQEARYYGYTLIQLGNMKKYLFDELYTIRRSNVNPELNIVMQDFYAMEGIEIDDPLYSDTLLYIKTPNEIGMAHDWGRCGYGILNKVAPYEIWYKQALTLWAEYQQLFGMPMRIGKTDTRNEQMRNQMAQMLENMGAAAWGVFDNEDSIEVLSAMSVTGGNDVYEKMITMLEKVISKIILGHADAMDSQPGKLGSSQGDDNPIHEAMEDIESFDCKFIENELESNILPKLYNLGFPVIPMGQRLCFVNNSEKVETRKKEDANNKVTADMVKVLADAGLEVDEVWFTERTGVPVTKKIVETVQPINNVQNILRREAIKNQLDKFYSDGCEHTH